MHRNKIRSYNYMINEINAIYHDIAVNLGISDSVLNVLYVICDSGESCLQSDIYKQTGISRKTINTAIHKLVKNGLVDLNQGQGRNTVVSLTDKGKAFADEKTRPLLALENEIYGSWSENELKIYMELTARYRDSLKEKSENLCKRK